MKLADEGKIAGILGTLIIHLIAGIIFMSFKVDSLRKKMTDQFQLELAQVEVPDDQQKVIELPSSVEKTPSVEKLFKGDDEMLSIAKNLANKNDVKIDPQKYIDQVKDELIKSGQLGADNYIDEQKRSLKSAGDEKTVQENSDSKKNETEKPKESQEMAANYQGPTRIYYDLKDRTSMYIDIPIYKCPGAGIIVMSIDVDQNGIVEKAEISERESTTNDGCLIETALRSAKASRFNPSVNAPRIQKGTLSYHFVAQ
jgi:hypothetical protein